MVERDAGRAAARRRGLRGADRLRARRRGLDVEPSERVARGQGAGRQVDAGRSPPACASRGVERGQRPAIDLEHRPPGGDVRRVFWSEAARPSLAVARDRRHRTFELTRTPEGVVPARDLGGDPGAERGVGRQRAQRAGDVRRSTASTSPGRPSRRSASVAIRWLRMAVWRRAATARAARAARLARTGADGRRRRRLRAVTGAARHRRSGRRSGAATTSAGSEDDDRRADERADERRPPTTPTAMKPSARPIWTRAISARRQPGQRDVPAPSGRAHDGQSKMFASRSPMGRLSDSALAGRGAVAVSAARGRRSWVPWLRRIGPSVLVAVWVVQRTGSAAGRRSPHARYRRGGRIRPS